MLYILALSFTAALFMYEPSNDGTVGNGMTKIEQLLPTPQSKSSVELENAEVGNQPMLSILMSLNGEGRTIF
jgi:hypothetical protein